jgi:hypothetical protein
METKLNTGRRLTLIAAALSATFATQAYAADLPSMGEESSPWQVDVTYENHTVNREHAGLAKFRNTLQVEADKKVGNGWGIHSILRGSYDGVYRMNSSEYGKDAGSKSAADLQFQNTVNGAYSYVPYGGGLGSGAVNAALDILVAPGAVSSAFVNAYGPNNPGVGMRMLGDRWHAIDGGVSFGVPVRPCDVDSRGCRDFGGYGDKKLSELEMPEFNSRLDFVRELYAKKTFDLGDGKELFLKLGKQQVVWGRTDLFRVLDVINPVDYSRNNIYDELSDIRIPMWIAQAEYRMGASDSMQDRNIQVVWNFDQFRANNLGQCGTPNVILDAGCFFRGMANLWDNGGTVSNFAHFNTGAAGALVGGGFPATPNMYMATNFGPHQIGIRNVNLPDWSLSNTQLGVKYEGVSASGLSFSLNALTYRSQLPSLHSINGHGTVNPFTSMNGNFGPAAAIPVGHLIAFDMYFPRVNLVGGSMDFQLPSIGAAVRLEGAYTTGEEFANTAKTDLFSKNDVFRSVIGIDRPTFVPFISETSATLFSGQLFYQHIFNHEWNQSSLGPVGMPDWKDNFIATLLIKAFLNNGTLSPQIIFAHDFQAQATAVAPQIEWNATNDLKITVGANYKLAEGRDRWKFDDCRSCNPYAPFTQYDGQGLNSGSAGLGGMEPLGRFRAGPIGAAFKENDIFVRVNYKF